MPPTSAVWSWCSAACATSGIELYVAGFELYRAGRAAVPFVADMADMADLSALRSAWPVAGQQLVGCGADSSANRGTQFGGAAGACQRLRLHELPWHGGQAGRAGICANCCALSRRCRGRHPTYRQNSQRQCRHLGARHHAAPIKGK